MQAVTLTFGSITSQRIFTFQSTLSLERYLNRIKYSLIKFITLRAWHIATKMMYKQKLRLLIEKKFDQRMAYASLDNIETKEPDCNNFCYLLSF